MGIYEPELDHSIMAGVLARVGTERLRQERLREAGRFTNTCASRSMSHADKLAVLVEEVGEVAREVLTQPDKQGSRANDTDGSEANLRKEIIQVAAVAVAWAESI